MDALRLLKIWNVPFKAKWQELEIMWSEVNQNEKDIYYMISPLWTIKEYKIDQ